MTKKSKDISKIPQGMYCYTRLSKNSNHITGLNIIKCPYWSMRNDKPHQENGYCSFLGRGDWEGDEFSLLWDQVKECGMNLHKKFFPCPDWENNDDFIFLGRERNPHTKKPYDFWLYKYGDDPKMWSPTARHGIEPHEYGSGPLCTVYSDKSHFGEDFKKDFIWGIERSNVLAMYYLITNRRPALRYNDE
jgi:hypothetical protein